MTPRPRKCPGIIDTNGNGKIDRGWTEPNEPVDPTKDHRINFGAYSITVDAKDGALWVSGIGRGDKRLVRILKGNNPPETCETQFYKPPPNEAVEVNGSGGVDSDSNAEGGRTGAPAGPPPSIAAVQVDGRSKATGQSCPEGWTFYRRTIRLTATASNTRTKAT
jgi:hypothetical protein